MKFLKDINWKNIAVIAVVAVVVVGVIYPLVKPTLKKIPVLGTYFA